MSVAEMFSDFVGNLAISKAETISTRYGELTFSDEEIDALLPKELKRFSKGGGNV